MTHVPVCKCHGECRRTGTCYAVLRNRDILVRIPIRGSVPLTNGSVIELMDPDPAIFVIDLHNANKKIFFLSFSAY
jgi:hypothetical protein